MIPNILFRGDSDVLGKRNLRSDVGYHYLTSNLIRGGNGMAIFSEALWDLINRHVDTVWQTTHFLSFSKSEVKATEYAMHDLDKTIPYYEFDGMGAVWDYAIIEFNCNKLEGINQIKTGLHEAYYEPELLSFARIVSEIKIRIIDVGTYLKSLPNNGSFQNAINKAERDEEWLILPYTPIHLNFDTTQHSGILDGGCLGRITKFSKSNFYSNSVFF